jgi:hypothetical protein
MREITAASADLYERDGWRRRTCSCARVTGVRALASQELELGGLVVGGLGVGGSGSIACDEVVSRVARLQCVSSFVLVRLVECEEVVARVARLERVSGIEWVWLVE